MEAILGKWEMEDADEESMKLILRKMGVPEPQVAMTAGTRYSLEYYRERDGFVVTTRRTNMVEMHNFRLGQEIAGETLDGRKIMRVITEEGAQMVERPVVRDTSHKNCELIKEVVDGQLVATTAVDGLTCKQIFKLVV